MRLGRGGFGNSPTSRIKKRFCRFACRVSFLGRSQPSGFTTSTTRARTPRPSQVSGTISGHQFLKTPRAYRIPQVLKLWRDPATFVRPNLPATYLRTLAAKNGIGISVSLERLDRHLGRLGLRG